MPTDDGEHAPGFDTPILFIVFSRPETTRRVFAAIATVQPRRLYIAADGPREDRANEAERCRQVRRIATAVTWPCEVRTLFQEQNLGCGRAVKTALGWFFEAEPEGIVLEDDCLPAPDFFPYAKALLAHYREDARVMAISGDNFQAPGFQTPGSYYFSRYPHCWGWASWRRAWALYDGEMSAWPAFRDRGGLADWSDGRPDFEAHWRQLFDRVAAGEIDTWDYQWTFSCWLHGGLSCLPAVNLVRNIGFDETATHTRSASHGLGGLPLGSCDLPLQHPADVVRDAGADRYTDTHVFGLGARGRRRLLGSRSLGRLAERLGRMLRPRRVSREDPTT